MTGLIDRGWRLFATGVSFAVFGLGGLVLALVVFPLFNLLVRDRERRAAMAQATVHAVWRAFIWLMKTLGVLTYEVHGAELLKEDRGTLVVANHPSLIDIVFIMSLMHRTQCVIKAGVWRNPFMRGAVTAANYIPNLGDPERLLDDCVAALKSGANLVIFPEGSRTPPGQKRKYQRGFAYVALRSGAPIRLVTLTCTPPTLLKGEPWYRIPPKRPHWVIRVHERIEALDGSSDPVNQPLAVRRLCAQVEARIEESLAA
ncbi:MAG TPA: lysophospholipid acyltransferase family protein [Caulobacterales bacterium]|nr:lysophospholipid acyltransferase family protein [Caulobacterales bacterium]